MALLEIQDLKIYYRISAGVVRAVDGVSFALERGQTLGLVGESGCGKTTAAKSIIHLLAQNGWIESGKILFNGRNIVDLNHDQVLKYRWEEVSMISQSAMNSLDPVYRVGDQIVEAIQAHRSVSRPEAYQRVHELFDLVGLSRERARDYPHQFSGGMKQRAVIAMALALDPLLIIADEPTTALDVLVRDQIIIKIKELLLKLQNAMILITHDISVVAETCERMVVMYAGKVMEYGDTEIIFTNPYNPYTLGLQNAFPSIKGPKRELVSIPGSPPNLLKVSTGCLFAERCPFETDICSQEIPSATEVEPGHYSFCHHIDRIEEMRELASHGKTWIKKGVI